MKALIMIGLLVASGAAAQENPWSSLGKTLAGTRNASEDAYRQRMRENLEMGAAAAQLEAAKREAEALGQQQDVREYLRKLWLGAGYGEEEATAYSRALDFNQINDYQAIRLSLRNASPEDMAQMVRTALGSQQFNHANKLLLASVAELSARDRRQPQ